MEPNLTFYYGRKIERIEINEGGEGGEWAIVLEGDVRIENFDENYEVPSDALVGHKFSMAVLDGNTTRLFFGTDDNPQATVMNLNPTEYGIIDPNMGGGLVRPQSSQAERMEAGLPLEPAAPGDRIVGGPDEEAQARLADPDPQLAEADERALEAAGDDDTAEGEED
jgi:hypothetical protein